MPASVPPLETHPLAHAALSGASVLYTDLDGTLLGPGARLLSDATGEPWLGVAEAVVSLNRAGLTCVVCSGRNRWQLMEVSRLLGWDSYIAEVGCVIVPGRGQEPIYYTGSWGPDALLEGETPYEAITRVGSLDTLTREFPGLIEEHSPWHVNREATHVLRGNLPLAEAQAALDTLELPVRIVDNGIVHPPRHTLRGVDRGPRLPPHPGRRAQERRHLARSRTARARARGCPRDRRLGDRRRDGRRRCARSARRKCNGRCGRCRGGRLTREHRGHAMRAWRGVGRAGIRVA
jgi:hypothetical protein